MRGGFPDLGKIGGRISRHWKPRLLAATLAAAAPAGAGNLVLVPFAGPLAADEWKAAEGSPKPRPADGGVAFPCPFRRGDDRFFWDRPSSFAIPVGSSLVLDLAADRPLALRGLTLYLRSGSGWYVGPCVLETAGRQRLTLRTTDFETEGKPAGWNAIDLVRLSAWKGQALDATVTVHALELQASRLAVIRATASARAPGDKDLARRLARRVSNWLDDAGVPHRLASEDDLAGALDGARTVILPFNPDPPEAMLKRLRAFADGGGRLMVFFSSSEELAKIMGLKLGAWTNSPDPARWRQIVFDQPEAWRAPPRVLQSSWNIRPALPASREARVIARWANDRGEVSSDPAWTASPAGFWMSHVPLEDDPRGKRRMLVALLGRLDGGVWRHAAARAVERAGRLDGFAAVDEAAEAIARMSSDSNVVAAVAAAREATAAMRTAWADERYADTVDAADRVRAKLTEAYGRAQAPREPELCGVWDHSGTGWYPGDWEATCRRLKEAGINTLFVNSLWAGRAHYPSKAVPASDACRLYGDQLAACLAAAHKHGIKVHLWKVCWFLLAAPPELVARLEKEGRLQQDAQGRRVEWLNPAVEENVRYELDALLEAATNYPVDGVHLDYIRYPDADACYAPASRAAFEAATGEPVAAWPQDVRGGGPRAAAYRAWRRGVITGFVRRTSEAVRAARPACKVSAAVWGAYPQCADSIGQDWGLWLRNGYVDFLCPMNYTEQQSRFAALTAAQMALPAARGRLCPGIGVTSSDSQLSADQVIEQVLAARRLGADGFVLFDLSPTLREDILPVLKLGITRRSAPAGP